MGATMSLLHFDEIAFYNYNWIIIPTAVNSMIKASENARRAGLPSTIIYTTTAGNPDTREGSYALSLFTGACPFTESFYDVTNRTELLDYISKNSNNRMLFLEFSYRQLGKTDEWFEYVSSRSNGSQDDIDRDLLNIWKASTDDAIIPKTLLRRIEKSKREPAYTDLMSGFAIRWYVDRTIAEGSEFKNRSLILGMDSSENIGRDYTTIVVVDPRDASVVATCRTNDSNVMAIARHIVYLLLMLPKSVYIPERSSIAIAILDFVIEELQKRNINPYTRIYNDVVQNLSDPKYQGIDIRSTAEIYGKAKSAFGYRTSGSGKNSRDILYKQTLMKALEMNADRVYDSILITELSNLTQRNGRIDHKEGLHDDTVIAYLLACYLIYFGNNLHLYGLDKSEVLELVQALPSGLTKEECNEQLAIKRRIAELESLLATNPMYILRLSYERELASLKQGINEAVLETEPLSVTQVEYHNEVLNNSGSNLEHRLRTFTNRFLGKR